MKRHFLILNVLVCFRLATVLPAVGADWKFDVTLSEAVREEAFSGRVYLAFSKGNREPRFQLNFFNFRPELILSRDVTGWKPGETISFSADEPEKMLAYPKALGEMNLAGFKAQAVVRLNPYDRKLATGAGNGMSGVVTIQAPAADAESQTFVVDKLVVPQKFVDTKWSKLLQIRSQLLSDFHKRDVLMNAAVMLPQSYYDNPDRRYPAIFTIPGFGGTHFSGRRTKPVSETNKQGVEFIRVLLDPSCPLGHHVFADSANNGPVGQALITELIPAFEKAYRSVAEASARFVTGHSSGGWSSLWLQVTYPDHFGGTWSTAPDPVDFRDFQRINLYHPGENMYVDAEGARRPLGRSRGRVFVHYKEFADNEWTLGAGGQLHSFEAVFSPRGKEGRPLLVWDRDTGVVNTDVAKTWEKYDIRLILEKNWKRLGPKLKGKLHVFMGDQDTFYLEGATILLKKSMEDLKTDAVVEIHSGKDHGTLMTRELVTRIRGQMVDAFLKNHPDWK